MSTNCGHIIYHINSSDQTEQSCTIGGNKVINPIYDDNQSLEYDATNEVPAQSTSSQENQDVIENEPLNSQPKKQDLAVIGKQKVIKKPRIVIGILVMLVIVCAGIVGILVSQI